MKTSKSPEGTDVTPSKKKLKQARLPFKLISEVSLDPVTPPRRKRKLSATVSESVPKVGKITKENDIVEVVISDNDSKDGETADKPDKRLNPYIKLVDTAIKNKQKSKASKKKRSSRKKPQVKENGPAEEVDKIDCEMMEVDEPITNQKISFDLTDSPTNDLNNKEETETVSKSSVDIIVLEDSNSSLDVKKVDSKIELLEESENRKDTSLDKDPDQSDDEKSQEESPNKTNHKNVESVIKNSDVSKTTEKMVKPPITPKRSARNKAKAEDNNNKGSSSSELNESLTPKQSGSSTDSKLDESLSESSAANLTPKQVSTCISFWL